MNSIQLPCKMASTTWLYNVIRKWYHCQHFILNNIETVVGRVHKQCCRKRNQAWNFRPTNNNKIRS